MNCKVPMLFGMALLTSLCFGHGNEVHVKGTVTEISDDSITIKTMANTIVTVAVVPETKFIKTGSPAKIHDLRVGGRVVVHARKIDHKLQAHTVRFGVAKRSARLRKAGANRDRLVPF